VDMPTTWVSFCCTGLAGMLLYLIPAAGMEFGFGTLLSRCRVVAWRRAAADPPPTASAEPIAAEPRLSPTP
jgi:hypothetical protein